MSYKPKLIALDELVKIAENMSDDALFDATKADSSKSKRPIDKRRAKHSADFWFSVHSHLKAKEVKA